MNILVIAPYTFPIGMAATNRIIAYSKGLVQNGVSVEVIIPFPTDTRTKNSYMPNEGIYHGIKFKFSSGRYKSSKKFLRGIAHYTGYRRLKGLLLSGIDIFKYNKVQRIDSIIISTDSLSALFFYSNLAKYITASSIFIFDEYPTPIRHKLKTKIPQWKLIALKIALKKISAYVSISKNLANFYNNLLSKPTLILSLIVDTSRFDNNNFTQNILANEKYLCYMGNMEISKDNVDVIIKAFSLIHKNYPDLKLRLYGSPSLKDQEYLQQLIVHLGLSNKAKILGKIDHANVSGLLVNAFILVSSQPNTVRASGGFPTKLGEYLASGIPTVITDVGENSKYVIHNKHCFLVEPDDQEAYANQLIEIIDDYEKAKSIALTGKELVLSKYSHLLAGQKLKGFIEKISGN